MTLTITLDLAIQPGGRFATVASLVDHIFLVEQRHTLRLQGRELPSESGIRLGDVDALWAHDLFYSKALV